MIFKSYLIEKNIKSLKNKIVLFYGENLGLKNQFKELIKYEYKEAEILRYFQEELIKNHNLLINEISNISLFEKKKIIFVEQANDKILDLIKEIQNIPSDQKIILFSDVLEKKSKLRNFFENSNDFAAIACYEDTEIGIRKIINESLKGYEGLSPQNINIIMDNSKLDRSKLYNELEKIKTFFNNKKIEGEKLEKLLDRKINDNFNILKDEAMMGNKIKTNKMLSDTILETEKNVYYINTINSRLLKLYEVRKLGEKDIEDSTNKLKPPVFWKDKNNFIVQAKIWNEVKIQKMLRITHDLEIKIKSNSIINKNILMKKLLVDVCELANAS